MAGQSADSVPVPDNVAGKQIFWPQEHNVGEGISRSNLVYEMCSGF